MMKYVKFDDESKREKMNLLSNSHSHGVETVFDHAITDDEREFVLAYRRVKLILKCSKAILPPSMLTSQSSLVSVATSMTAPTTSSVFPQINSARVREIIMKL